MTLAKDCNNKAAHPAAGLEWTKMHRGGEFLQHTVTLCACFSVCYFLFPVLFEILSNFFPCVLWFNLMFGVRFI